MAKSSVKAGGTSRIRFVMVDAEIADGDLGQITQAIQNALRGPVPNQRIALANGTKTMAHDATEVELEIEAEDEDVSEPVQRQAKTRAPRKPAPTPEVLNVDLTTDPSFASFAAKANPKSDRKRYLVVAAWFKESRGLDAITANHIYTCYRAVKWPSSISDFSQPLRDLKGDQLMTSPERGSYAINHLGIAEVEKLLSGGE